MVKLDKVDMQILNFLQEDGRLNNAEIAKRVFLSPPACWKRLKFLEQEVIKNYRAFIEPKSLGYNFYAFMNITLDLHSEEFLGEFARGHPAQCRMGTTLVIVYAPDLDFAPGILLGHKPVLVQALLPQPAVE